MEGVPQPQFSPEAEGGFDRETIAMEAADTARRYLSERIDSTLKGEERFTEIINLMEDLSEDNGNRFIVEALAQRLSLEKAAEELEDLQARYPLAA